MAFVINLTDAERVTLEQLAQNYRHLSVRKRAAGIVLLDKGVSTHEVASRLRVHVSRPAVWGNAWIDRGICGLFVLKKRGSGRRRLLPASMLAQAVKIAKSDRLTLPQLAQRLQVICNEPLPCSLQVLRRALRSEGIRLKGNRALANNSALVNDVP